MKDRQKGPSSPVAVGLVHWPVIDKNGSPVCTNITNLDLHDIARACTVYGIDRYYLIHPSQEQLMFVHRVLEHWRLGRGARYNPKRAGSLEGVATAPSVEKALLDWGKEDVLTVVTSAREGSEVSSFTSLREKIWNESQPVFLLFGTGHGLAEQLVQNADQRLEPLRGTGPRDYRHFSVRSAVSICLDRLLGVW